MLTQVFEAERADEGDHCRGGSALPDSDFARTTPHDSAAVIDLADPKVLDVQEDDWT